MRKFVLCMMMGLLSAWQHRRLAQAQTNDEQRFARWKTNSPLRSTLKMWTRS